MPLTPEDQQEYIDLAFGLALDRKQYSDEIASKLIRELFAHIAVIEQNRLPEMQKYLDVLQKHNAREQADEIVNAMSDMAADAQRSRLALVALQSN